ncbi:MAG TPA: ABC transporter ATP-binding protein, partial [Pseudonocardiaceae bacterium]|nr:ABC transporter ATP-binding protein [Pseudonocardiaceae bacterium]
DDLLASHVRYLGPRSDAPPGPGDVLGASHTDRQSSFLVRLPAGTTARPVADPWVAKPVTLEDFVLGYLTVSRSDDSAEVTR